MVARIITGLSAGAAYALVAVGIVLIYKCTRMLSLAQGEIGAFGFFIGLRWAARGDPGARLASRSLPHAVHRGRDRRAARCRGRAHRHPPPRRSTTARRVDRHARCRVVPRAARERAVRHCDPVRAVAGRRVEGDGARRDTHRAADLRAWEAAAVVALAIYLFFSRTRFGLAVRATTGDPTVAKLMGVRVNRVYLFAWITAGALAGLGAALLGSRVRRAHAVRDDEVLAPRPRRCGDRRARLDSGAPSSAACSSA